MKDNLYTRLYLWLVGHRWMVLALLALLTVAGVVISSRINLEEDILDMLPRHDQRVDEYRYALRKFRQIDRIYLDVGINADDPERLGHAADEVFAALSTNSAYVRIMYRVEIGGQGKVIDFLTGALPNLFTEADARELEQKLEPAAVREHLTTMRRKLAGPEGMVLKDVVAADPINSSALVVAKVLPLQTGFGGAQIVDGRITSGDGRHVLMMAEPKFGSSDSRASTVLIRELLQMVREVERQFPGVHVAITGGHRMSVDNAAIIRSDATRCISIGTVAMLALCLMAYRRRWLALVTFLPSFFGTLIAGVVLALWQEHLSAIALGFASIAIGVTVDYAIHVIYHLDDAGSADHRTIGRHLSGLVFPVVVGVITTIAAFLVMTGSPMHGYQQMGILGAIGVIFSSAFALVILPLLVPVPKKAGQPPLWLTQWWERYFDWESRRRFWLLAFVGVLTVVTGLGVRRLRFEGDISKMNGITTATRQDDELINKTWGEALGMTMVLARGQTAEEALEQNDRAVEILRRDPNVSAVFSLSAVCPSAATQEANLRRWREFWTPVRRASLGQTLQQVGTELGFRPDAFAKFWQTVEGKPALLTLDMFRGTPLEQALTERVALGTNDNAVSTLLKLENRADVAGLREKLPGMYVLDGRDFASHIAGLAKSSLHDFVLWTGLAVAGLLFLSLASVELVVITLLPIGLGLIWTFGVMGWLGLPIDLMNSIFVIFIIGVSEDYSVFMVMTRLDEWRGRPKHTAVASASVFISALTTIFGFGVMVLASHPVLFSMGTTVLIGMGFAFVVTLVLTPMCMDLLLFKEQPRGAPRWWHVLGTVWVVLHLGGSQLFLYYVLRPILKIISPRTADDQLRRATRWMARGVVKGMPFGKLEFQNISRETFSPPCIVISNHQSAVDVMLVVSLPGDVRQTAKKRVFDAPMLGVGCKLLGHVMVEPNDPQTTLQRCRERLAGGACVHFYPEGTRSPDGFVQRFHRGAFELAVELNQEILPVIICDSNTAMPRDAYWFEPFHCTVRALPRVTPQNFDYAQGVVPLMKHCDAIVRAGLQQQLDEINTPRVVRRKVARLYRYQGVFIEQFAYWKLRCDPMFAALDSVVPRQGFILDLGCGYGLATQWLACFTDGRRFLGIDYDEEKIRVAKRTATEHPRIQFESGDILERDYPSCDVVLLLDVLHYWTPGKQQLILNKARQALRPGGRLILRDGARAQDLAHGRVHRWEKFATRVGMNRTMEGLHFQTQTELEAMLRSAGFTRWETKSGAGNDSNVMLIAMV
ncbi:MAG: 1-acyl-sn-glycerol-3-phosphate acyltransferase [Verrucomicrobiota bacterium]